MSNHHLNTGVAMQIAQAIQDHLNPARQQEAMLKRDKWLFENDQGLLSLTAEERKVLEEARP